MKRIRRSTQFKKDYKRVQKAGKNFAEFVDKKSFIS